MNKKIIFASLLAGGTFLVCVFLLEIFLRLFLPANPFDARLYLRPYIHRINRVNLRGVTPLNNFTTNKWGMRGENPPVHWNDYRTIIAVGGSTTQCFYLDDKNTWPAQLGGILGGRYDSVWVGNGGIDGHSTNGHRIFMHAVLRTVKPTLAIFLVGVNDLGRSLQGDASAPAFESFNVRSWLLAHSRVLQLGYLWKQILIDKAVVVQKSDHTDYVPVPIDKETPLPDGVRAALPSLESYRDNLQAIISEGKRNHIAMLFLTQPMLYDDNDYWRKKLGAMYWVRNSQTKYSAATYWNMMQVFNNELMAVCRENGVPCYDLASAIPHSADYFYDIVHFNDAGARLVAKKVSAYIEENRLIER